MIFFRPAHPFKNIRTRNGRMQDTFFCHFLPFFVKLFIVFTFMSKEEHQTCQQSLRVHCNALGNPSSYCSHLIVIMSLPKRMISRRARDRESSFTCSLSSGPITTEHGRSPVWWWSVFTNLPGSSGSFMNELGGTVQKNLR